MHILVLVPKPFEGSREPSFLSKLREHGHFVVVLPGLPKTAVPPDMVFCLQNANSAARAAIYYRLLQKVPFVWDIQHFPKSSMTCRFLYRVCNRLTVPSDGFAKALTDQGAPSGKLHPWPEDKKKEGMFLEAVFKGLKNSPPLRELAQRAAHWVLSLGKSTS